LLTKFSDYQRVKKDLLTYDYVSNCWSGRRPVVLGQEFKGLDFFWSRLNGYIHDS